MLDVLLMSCDASFQAHVEGTSWKDTKQEGKHSRRRKTFDKASLEAISRIEIVRHWSCRGHTSIAGA